MKIEYILEENDYVNYYLYTIAVNKKNKKLMNKSKFALVIFFLFTGVNLYKNNIFFSIIFGLMAILTMLFYNKFYKYSLKNHYSKMIKKNYAKKIGKKLTMEITPEQIITKEKIGESKIMLSEIEQIIEIKDNFFIKLSNGTSFIISKKGLRNIDDFKKKWEELNIPIIENLYWEWK